MVFQYKDFLILVYEICDPEFGNGLRAEFYLVNTERTQAHAQRYDTFERGVEPAEIAERVTHIIDQYNY